MKRILTVMMALALIMGLAMNVQAANKVQLTLTAPSISKIGCEKVGAVTFSFDNGTVLQAGDWWYFDLDTGATLCKNIDYFIVGAAAARNAADALALSDPTNQLVDDTATVNPNATILGLATANVQDGPFQLTGATAAITQLAGNVYLRVVGDAGTRRINVYVYGGAAGASIRFDAPGTADNISLTIGNGFAYDGTPAGNAGNPVNLANAVTILRASGTVVDSAANTVTAYKATIPTTNETVVPFVNNTLCVDSTQFAGNDIYTSFTSKNDFLTFTGDSKIAHVAPNSLSMAFCKAAATVLVPIASQGSCSFDFDAGTAAAGNLCSSSFGGNRLILTSANGFASDEKYSFKVTSNTPGVYISGAAAAKTYIAADYCTSVAAAQTFATTIMKLANGTVTTASPSTSCTVATNSKVVSVETAPGVVQNLGSTKGIWIDMPTFAYDKSEIAEGTEIKVTVSLDKAPCGVAATGTFTLGSFVTTCPTSGGSTSGTTLMYPFLPPMAGLGSWWGGFTLTNMNGTAGTATLTFMEYDGDKATLSINIPAGQTYVATSDATLLAAVTVDVNNTGTFGDSNIAIQAVCNFPMAAGMTFTGNGTEGVGYTAYVKNGTLWQ